MKPLNILVYEDESSIAKGWKEAIEAVCHQASVETVDRPDFQELLRVIHRRRAESRKSENEGNAVDCSIEADEADVIVVDYDLLRYFDDADTTGSRLAYLLRCFTQCGFIVVLNAYGPNVFDLSLGQSDHRLRRSAYRWPTVRQSRTVAGSV